MNIHWKIFLNVHSTKMERDEEMLYLKEGSRFQFQRQGRISTEKLQQTREKLGVNQGEKAINKLLLIYDK